MIYYKRLEHIVMEAGGPIFSCLQAGKLVGPPSHTHKFLRGLSPGLGVTFC